MSIGVDFAPMTIAVTGADGQLGTELCQQLGESAIPLTLPEFDLTNRESIESCLRSVHPRVVINTAAYTAVDKAEEDAEVCQIVNADSIRTLAELCRQIDCPLVQISTDYVFSGASGHQDPYRETDLPRAKGVYAISKLRGESHAATWEKHYVVRSCGLYSNSPVGPIRGRNFVDTILSLAIDGKALSIVDDQICSPTYVPHLAAAIRFLIRTGHFGTYHITNTGATSWFDFATELLGLAQLDVPISPTTTAKYVSPAPRPYYSVLNTEKYHALGGPRMPTWQEGLADYIAAMNKI